MLVYYSQAWLTVPVYTCVWFLWPEVQSHSDDSHMHVTVPCSARVFAQGHGTEGVCPHEWLERRNYESGTVTNYSIDRWTFFATCNSPSIKEVEWQNLVTQFKLIQIIYRTRTTDVPYIYIYKTDSEGIHSTMWGSLRLAPMNVTQQCSGMHVISEILGHCCDRQSDKHQCGKVDQGS